MPWRHAEREDGEAAWLADCWIWTGYTKADGTPVVRTAESQTTARRAYYERENGPVPEGKVLHAMCGVKVCVRPSHHRPVSHEELWYLLGRTLATRENRQAAARLRLRGLSNREIARRLGLNEWTVRNMLRHRYYDPRRTKNASRNVA